MHWKRGAREKAHSTTLCSGTGSPSCRACRQDRSSGSQCHSLAPDCLLQQNLKQTAECLSSLSIQLVFKKCCDEEALNAFRREKISDPDSLAVLLSFDYQVLDKEALRQI